MLTRFTSLIRPLHARNVDESHRASTPLELFFDLVAVLAFSSVAGGFHHALCEGHELTGLLYFSVTFLIVWLPWNLFTWFASAFDNDDPLYRLMVMVMMVGFMIIAADLTEVFGELDFKGIFVGYAVMRLAIIVLWIRAGRDNPDLRKTTTRYVLCQLALLPYWALLVFWIELTWVLGILLFLVGFAMELSIPWFAEKSGQISWHPNHILERFGLLNIIVLGEILLGTTELLRSAFEKSFDWHLIYLTACGMVIAFSMWWLYFADAANIKGTKIRSTLLWSYGHTLIFAGALATGAALAASTEIHFRILENGIREASGSVRWAVSLSIATYLWGVWLVRDRFACSKGIRWALLIIAVLIALSPLLARRPYLPPALLALAVLLRQLGKKPADSSIPA